MFCAVKAINRRGGTRSDVFNTHFTFRYLGQISVTEAILVHCGVVVPQFTIRGPGKPLLNFTV